MEPVATGAAHRLSRDRDAGGQPVEQRCRAGHCSAPKGRVRGQYREHRHPWRLGRGADRETSPHPGRGEKQEDMPRGAGHRADPGNLRSNFRASQRVPFPGEASAIRLILGGVPPNRSARDSAASCSWSSCAVRPR